MKNAPPVIAAVLVGLAIGCGAGSTPTQGVTTPTSQAGTSSVKFLATLSPLNEVPPVTDAESSGSGTATITLNVTKDAGGNITAATADFQVSLSGFPATTVLTAGHIHPGALGINGSVLVGTGVTSGDNIMSGGAGSFTRNGINVAASDAQAIINTPVTYYFNVHSVAHGGGFARGQLVKQ